MTLGADSLGAFTRISGELDLNLEKSAGTLRLWGSGKDSLGGDFVSAAFDLTSTVGKPSL